MLHPATAMKDLRPGDRYTGPLGGVGPHTLPKGPEPLPPAPVKSLIPEVLALLTIPPSPKPPANERHIPPGRFRQLQTGDQAQEPLLVEKDILKILAYARSTPVELNPEDFRKIAGKISTDGMRIGPREIQSTAVLCIPKLYDPCLLRLEAALRRETGGFKRGKSIDQNLVGLPQGLELKDIVHAIRAVGIPAFGIIQNRYGGPRDACPKVDWLVYFKQPTPIKKHPI